jgi:hypothetical protein
LLLGEEDSLFMETGSSFLGRGFKPHFLTYCSHIASDENRKIRGYHGDHYIIYITTKTLEKVITSL